MHGCENRNARATRIGTPNSRLAGKRLSVSVGVRDGQCSIQVPQQDDDALAGLATAR